MQGHRGIDPFGLERALSLPMATPWSRRNKPYAASLTADRQTLERKRNPRSFRSCGRRPRSGLLRTSKATALFRHGLDDALRSHGWNDSRQLVIGRIEQSVKLSFGTFCPPVIASIFRSRSLLNDIASVSGTTMSTINTLPFPGIARRQFLRILIARESSQSWITPRKR